ncbi:winged helix-turn-helix transcriptional regulator [Thermostaphylospora chromogena]|uniref:winged helix-turn-helix transcriptional regulator n=1 Tax=Thermostaphylospora chromogena TaxID=35622 RepID=UPI000B80410A|nr:helix-turn-helix domain-containing protein [Thermostaphylospora chromogena]
MFGHRRRVGGKCVRRLTADGLISRTAYAEVPSRVEYALTPFGGGLYKIVKQLIDRAADHHDEIRANRSRGGTEASSASRS